MEFNMRHRVMAGLFLLPFASPAAAADWYASLGSGASTATATSNSDEVEFGSETEWFATIEGGRAFTFDGVELRAGVEGLYAPKSQHGQNKNGRRETADGQTFQAGGLLATGTAVATIVPYVHPYITVGAGPAIAGGVTYGASAGAGVEVPLDDQWSIAGGYRYTVLGPDYQFYGPQARVIFKF